jgi:aldose 1-epimerase
LTISFSESFLIKSIAEEVNESPIETNKDAATVASAATHKRKNMKESFGMTTDGAEVGLYTLRNVYGLEAGITNYGAILVSLMVPDRKGKFSDVVLGFDNLAGYLNEHPCFGATIGRYANRIAAGRLSLEGKAYQLTRNNEGNHLHGGLKGFDKVIWIAAERKSAIGPALDLRYVSRDGEEGYPGELTVEVTYTLRDDNELQIDYTATTDKTTIVNLTHHSYFNLRDAGATDILGHKLTIDADHFLPIDQSSIPTGEIRTVKGTPFDFRKLTPIGTRIGQRDLQLLYGNGYNHNWVLNRPGQLLTPAATVCDSTSGRMLEVLTTEPGLQFFSGNFPAGKFGGKGGKTYPSRSGLCLEAQHYPNSPQHSEFPSTVLRPGENYLQTTKYRFSIF